MVLDNELESSLLKQSDKLYVIFHHSRNNMDKYQKQIIENLEKLAPKFRSEVQFAQANIIYRYPINKLVFYRNGKEINDIRRFDMSFEELKAKIELFI